MNKFGIPIGILILLLAAAPSAFAGEFSPFDVKERREVSVLDFENEFTTEWIRHSVMAGGIHEITKDIEGKLNAAFSKIPPSSDSEIAELIEMEKEQLRKSYDKGTLTKDEYEREHSDATNKKRVKRGLFNAALNIRLEDSLGAAEFLAALLGVPTPAFEDMSKSYGQTFRASYWMLKQGADRRRLKKLVPIALKVVAKYSNHRSAYLAGWYHKEEQDSWLQSLKNLRANLDAVAR